MDTTTVGSICSYSRLLGPCFKTGRIAQLFYGQYCNSLKTPPLGRILVSQRFTTWKSLLWVTILILTIPFHYNVTEILIWRSHVLRMATLARHHIHIDEVQHVIGFRDCSRKTTSVVPRNVYRRCLVRPLFSRRRQAFSDRGSGPQGLRRPRFSFFRFTCQTARRSWRSPSPIRREAAETQDFRPKSDVWSHHR
jgi:hypothetical protein